MIDSEQLQYFNGESFHLLNSEQNISERYNEYSMNRTADYDDSYQEEMNCMNFANHTTYLNISCETNLSYSVPLYGYFAPFLLFTTVTVRTHHTYIEILFNECCSNEFISIGQHINCFGFEQTKYGHPNESRVNGYVYKF